MTVEVTAEERLLTLGHDVGHLLESALRNLEPIEGVAQARADLRIAQAMLELYCRPDLSYLSAHFERHPVDLSQVVREALAICETGARFTHDLEVDIVCDRERILADVDGFYLERTMLVLIVTCCMVIWPRRIRVTIGQEDGASIVGLRFEYSAPAWPPPHPGWDLCRTWIESLGGSLRGRLRDGTVEADLKFPRDAHS